MSVHFVDRVRDEEYAEFLKEIQMRYELIVHNNAIFTIREDDPDGLFKVYLENIPVAHRQYHCCHSCRAFFRQYGGLVMVEPTTGELVSAFWSVANVPKELRKAVKAVIKVVQSAKIETVFLSSEEVYGHPMTNDWTHLSIRPPFHKVYRGGLKTDYRAAAEKREEHITVGLALREYNAKTVETAVILLESEALYRSEKVLGQAKWLLDIHISMVGKDERQRTNMVWLAVANAPAGFCHPRSSMISTLLDDIAQGLNIQDVKRRFDLKMNPMKYMRPTAAPAAGNIVQANQIISKMGLEASFNRRFARVVEVQKIWSDEHGQGAMFPPRSAKAGLFSSLQAKQNEPMTSLNSGAITWTKFEKTVLPQADSIHIYLERFNLPFATMVTATDMTAPPIIQWDDPEVRNPFSWYLYQGGRPSNQFGLIPGQFHKVVGLSYQPNMWHSPDKYTNNGQGVLFMIENARDQLSGNLCLFPEILKSELHGVRSTVEAFNTSRSISDADGPYACGIIMQKSTGTFNHRVRVTTGRVVAEYKLDRWD